MKTVLLIILFLASLHADVKHFKNTQEAVDTFIVALKDGNKQVLSDLFTNEYKKLIKIKELDSDDLNRFLNTYEKFHRLASFDGKSVYIEVGNKGWTFPIPLMKDKNGWYFDIGIGIENMITREIGRNELSMIAALRAGDELEDLQAREDLQAFEIFKNKEYIVALPKNYGKTAIMSFVVDGNGNIYEANLEEIKYIFDNRFKKIDEFNWRY